jgi:hypothetical protein
MGAMKSFSLVLLGFVLACGGTTGTVGDAGSGDGSGSSGSSGSSSGGSSGGSSGSGSGGSSGGSSGSSSGGSSGSSGSSSGGSSSGVDGGATCNALLMQIDQLRPKAETCCPFCNHAPCQFTVTDLCCPLTVDLQGSMDVMNFENAIQQFKSNGCSVVCPAMPCPMAPSMMCDGMTSLCKQ